MAVSPDHPDLLYVQAKGYTPGRPYGNPIWVVWHDMEAFETADRAERTAAYFANPPDGRRVSAQYCWDLNSGVQCVRLHDSAWTVGNREGNYLGINHELAGFASQNRAQWLDAFGRGMFAQLAPTVRKDMAKFRIPLQRRTVGELRARIPGHTSHNDLREAFGGTTHTDPGPNFPWDVLFNVIAGTPAPSTPKGALDMLIPTRVVDADGVTVRSHWLGNGFYHRPLTKKQAEDQLVALRILYGNPSLPFMQWPGLSEVEVLQTIGPTPWPGDWTGGGGGGVVDISGASLAAIDTGTRTALGAFGRGGADAVDPDPGEPA